MKPLQIVPAAVAIGFVAASAAPAAQPTDHNMRVNEVYPAAPGEAFVELLDVLPGGEDPPAPSTRSARTTRPGRRWPPGRSHRRIRSRP
jgi:hypothetical protein